MIKLLLVDDEQIEREGMQAILERSFSTVIIQQASNGQMAVEIANEFQPELVLMDIKMPGMNGLEAVERISARHPSTHFIMVTAFDSFEYMRHAIKLGVKDYILKPSKPSDIVVTVGRILNKIEEEKQFFEKEKLRLQKTLAVIETDVVTQLLYDHVHEVHVDMLIEMLEIPYSNEMFIMLVVLPGSEKVYHSSIKEKVRASKSGWVGPLYNCQLPIVVFRDTTQSFRSQAMRLAREILSLAKVDFGEEWFIGIGSECTSWEGIRQSYHHALMSSMDTGIPAKFHFYSDDVTPHTRNQDPLKKHREKEFSDLIRRGEWEQIRVHLMNITQFFENENGNILYTQQRLLEVLWLISRVFMEMGIETQTPMYTYQISDYRQLQPATDQLLDRMIKSYEEHFSKLEADTIHQLKQYIIEHSQHDISLDTLAKRVGLSPIYISKMFKEKLGINYIDFLTECRMEKAKKLLSDPRKSIKEITFEVGYHDPNYFSKVFKKVNSFSPKEYRKSLIGK
ncbi:response regulator [Bacillus salitolerans]|uniref:Response regulator n=1 Tax=Bacillus salitolerans TaxID=1437434 RepID=A0ABW4LXY0_9BACI